MAKCEITVGSADQTIDVYVQNAATGQPYTGLVYNTSGLTCYYRKGATGSATQLSLVTQTVGGAHSDGGFVEIDATNMPGQYRLDLSDTIVVALGRVYLSLKGAANMSPCPIEIEVVSVDKFVSDGHYDVDIARIAGSTVGVVGFDRATRAIVTFTVTSGATTTSIPTSSMDPAAAVTDQFKDQVLKFDKDTTTANLRGVAAAISASTAGGTITVSPALPATPASGDKGTIS